MKKVAIVTGGANGIGRKTSELLLKEGVIVYVLDSDEYNGCIFENEMKVKNLPLHFMKTDMAIEEEMRKSVNYIYGQEKKIDILFNNVGITWRANVIDTPIDVWDKVMNVNVRSYFIMSKLVIPIMIENGAGAIVNTASGWGIVGGENAVSYCASKGAVVLLTKALAVDHGKDNIRVNCVCPGDTETNLLRDEEKQLGLPENELIRSGSNRPLGRIGQPENIADAVLFLTSDKASFITGEALVIDGGSLAGSL